MKLQITYLPIEGVKPYSNNPRKNKKAVDIVKKSIQAFGFRNPIIIDKNNVIIAGHTRLEAAKQLEFQEVPVIYAEDLTPEQVNAFRIMDNKSNEYATWDEDLLKVELECLKRYGLDLELTGFRETEINRILSEDIKESNIGNKPAKYEIKQGDIYQLGEHKIICGDSTKQEIVDKLLERERV